MEEKKRIIFAISSSIAGGAQIYLYNIVEYIKSDYSVMVLCPEGFFYDKVKKLSGVEVVKQSISAGSVKTLKNILTKEAKKHEKIYVNAHLLGTGLWIERALKNIRNAVLSITVHNKVIYENISLARRIVYPWCIKYMSKRTNGFIAVSQEIADSVAGFTGRNCEYIPSSVPIKGEPKDVAVYDPQGVEIKVGFVGRVSPPKNPVRFVETAALIAKDMPNVQFVVVGDGELRTEMEQKVKEVKMEDRFRFLGFLPNPAEEMRKLDVLLLTSDYEGTPMVLLEAMSYGVPVVSTRVGGIPLVIENWKDGVLTSGFEPAAIAKDVVALLSDNEKYVAISKAAYHKIKEKFSYENNIRRYMEIVQLGNKNPDWGQF